MESAYYDLGAAQPQVTKPVVKATKPLLPPAPQEDETESAFYDLGHTLPGAVDDDVDNKALIDVDATGVKLPDTGMTWSHHTLQPSTAFSHIVNSHRLLASTGRRRLTTLILTAAIRLIACLLDVCPPVL